mmetsp:Transcript_83015/g.232664  ORF Transcript_83015/g.232664 Transcript_83015/m.232664 type:complete len:257 (+) Transcript_83015:90-860(+)
MAAPNNNLFIGDLPPDVDDDFVMNIFSAYGSIVSVKSIPPKAGGTKGAALVKFESLEEATWVQENLNGNMPEGMDSPIVVSYARSGGGGGGPAAWGKSAPSKGAERFAPYPPKGGGKGFDFGGKGPMEQGTMDFRTMLKGLVKGGNIPGAGPRPEDQCVYIKGLPPDTSDFNLYEIFAPFGAIAPMGVKAMIKDDGSCNSIGFVDFQDPHSAQMAVQALNGTQLPDGTVLQLNIKRPRKGAEKGGGADKGGCKGYI